MNDEKKCEIIKSLAYGMDMEQIAEPEDVSITDVEQVAYDEADRVARGKEYLSQSGRL